MLKGFVFFLVSGTVLAGTTCNIAVHLAAGEDVSGLLQACIDATNAGDSLSLEPGVYLLGTGIIISKPIQIISAAMSEPCSLDNLAACPILRALPTFYHSSAILTASNVDKVWLERIVIDGNRAERLDSVASTECKNNVNNRNSGRNVVFNGCEGCTVGNSVVANSLCASSFVWVGAGAKIYNNIFANNGEHNSNLMWSDGVTCLSCDSAQILNNVFVGNSDVDLILGGGKDNTVISGNRFIHDKTRPVFAAMMLDNFNGETSGLFSGLILQSNNIDCGVADCCYGIQVGPRPWYPSAPVSGSFKVDRNSISGAGVGINLDAASGLVTLEANSVANTAQQFTCTWLCGASQQGSAINVSPESVAAFSGGQAASSATTYKCP